MRHFEFCLAFAVSMAACAGPDNEARVPTSPYGEPHLTWAACPEELGGVGIQCTQAQVPLDWDDADGRYTSILVRRVSFDGQARGQLWLLDGGPGFAGDDFLNETLLALARTSQLEVIVPSHRGTVGESALRCRGQSPDSPEGGRVTVDEWSGCLTEMEEQWGKGLAPFTVRQAARDVAYLMRLPPWAGKSYVFGGSYGSLWAQRLLLDTDARPDAVLLDSIVPIGATLERVDTHADQAAEAILQACAQMESCAQRFDGDPSQLSRKAISAYARGEGCGGPQLSASAIQTRAYALLNGPPQSWIQLVSLYERLVRCDAEDARALTELIERSSQPTTDDSVASPGPVVRYNPLLNRQLLYRELYRFDVTGEERKAFEESALAVGTDAALVAKEAEIFGAGYRQIEAPATATSAVPTYLLSGRFDPLDPPQWAEDFNRSLTHGELIRVPWAGHSTLRYLGWEEQGCGRRVFSSFLAGNVNFECVDSLPAVDLGQERRETRDMIDSWWSSP